jgi:HSP20 family protein
MSGPNPSNENRLGASVERLKREIEGWVDAAVSQGGRALDAFGLRGTDRPWMPPVDVVETSDSVLVYIDLPGVDGKSVDVALAGNMLTVKGEKSLVASGEGTTLHLRERSAGPFERSVPLPASVNADSVHAEAKDGVIRLRFAKSVAAKPRQIPIT